MESHSGYDFSKRCVFTLLMNLTWLASLSSLGRLFHVLGPAALKEPC